MEVSRASARLVNTPSSNAMWMHYLIVFAVSVVVDVIPVMGPSAWVIMVFMQVKFDLNPWINLAACVTGTTLGRYLQILYLPKMAEMLIRRYKKQDLEFLGKNLAQTNLRCWGIVLLHTLTPLPITALFAAAALAKVPAFKVLLPFFVAKTASDGVILAMSLYVAGKAQELMDSFFSLKTVVGMVIGVGMIFLYLAIDWHLLLQKKKLALRLKFWRRRRTGQK